MARRNTSASAKLIRAILTGQNRSSSSSPTPLDKQLNILTGLSTYKEPVVRRGLGDFNLPSKGSNSFGIGGLSNFIDNTVGQGMKDLLHDVPSAPSVMSGSKHPVGSGQDAIAKAAINAINAQYGPALGLLGKQIHHTKLEGRQDRRRVRNRGNRAVGDIAVLYGRLGRGVNRARKVEDRAYGRGIKETRRDYRNTRNTTKQQYDTSIGSAAKELQRLGIDPSVALSGAAKDKLFLTNASREDQHNRVLNQRDSRREFNGLMRRMKADTLATGAADISQSKAQTQSALSDLAKNVADNIFQLRMQRSQLQGQRAGAISTQRIAAMQAAAKANNPTARLDRQIKRAQLDKLLGIIPAADTAKPPTDPVGKSLYFLEQNADKLPHVAGLQNIMNYVVGGAGPGQRIPFDKQSVNGIWNALVKTGKRHNWSATEMNYLQRALQIALGL